MGVGQAPLVPVIAVIAVRRVAALIDWQTVALDGRMNLTCSPSHRYQWGETGSHFSERGNSRRLLYRR